MSRVRESQTERTEKGDAMLEKKVLPPGWKFRGAALVEATHPYMRCLK